MPRIAHSTWSPSPTVARILLLVGAVANLLGGGSVRAQAPVDAAEIAARAGVRAPAVWRAELGAARAHAVADAAARPPNPSLVWERQQAFAPNAQRQDLLWARMPLDLSGRRAAERTLRRVDAAEAEARVEVARREAVAAALRLFYRAVAAERRVELRAQAQQALDEGARIAERRAEAGEASRYAASRLALEASLARSALAEAEAEVAALRERLLGPLELPLAAPLEGPDAGTGASPPAAPVDEEPAEGAEGRGARAMVREARSAGRAARRAAIPRVTASAAYNRQAGPEVGHGYGIELQLELPLFDRGQAARGEAAAVEQAAARLAESWTAAQRAEVEAAAVRLRGLRAERARLAESLPRLEGLLRAAEAGYREGERSLVELLDARRTALAVRERLIALEAMGWLVELEWRRAAGRLP